MAWHNFFVGLSASTQLHATIVLCVQRRSLHRSRTIHCVDLHYSSKFPSALWIVRLISFVRCSITPPADRPYCYYKNCTQESGWPDTKTVCAQFHGHRTTQSAMLSLLLHGFFSNLRAISFHASLWPSITCLTHINTHILALVIGLSSKSPELHIIMHVVTWSLH
jgi:hypothetical protein